MSSKKKKSQRKKYDSDSEEDIGDYVNREISKAMKQVEKAMQQVKVAEKTAGKTYKATKHAPGVQTEGAHTVVNIPSMIVMENCQNVQVGNNNVLHIRKERQSSKSRPKEAMGATGTTYTATEGRAGIRGAEGDIEDRRSIIAHPSEDVEQRLQVILGCTDPVTPTMLEMVSTKIGKNWKRIMRNLGLENDHIDQIYHDNYVHGLREIIHQSLKEWVQVKGPEATVGELAQVCKKTDHMDALNVLQNFVT